MSWKVIKLGDLIENFSVKAKDYNVDASTLDFLGVSNTDGITKSKYAAEEKANDYKIMEKGCFAYNPYRINVGSIAMLNEDTVGLISPAYVVFKVKEKSIIPELLLKFLKSSEGLRQIKSHARGTVRQALRFSDLCEIKIALPGYDEQLELYEKISKTEIESNFLSTELTHQLDTVKKLRQAFLREAMQGKLTEKWREAQKTPPRLGKTMQCKLTEKMRETQKTPPLLGEVPKAEGLRSKNINNLPHLKTFRKQLRKNLTPAEAKLWTMLKGKQLEGRKFRRQFSVASYILDFYCPSEKLAIELDGQGHFEATQAEYDHERDLFLLHTGIKVLRFENKCVWDNPEGLLEGIKSYFTPPQSANTPQSASGQLPLKGEQFEDARDLLAEIKAEKERLIKEKKIKKQKPLPPISQEEIPFEIPENWVWCRLGEIINFGPSNGFSPRKNKKDEGIKCLTLTATTYGAFNGNHYKYVDEIIPEDSYLWVKENDILLQRGNSIDFVGIAALCENINDKYIYPDLMIKIRVGKLISPKYIHKLLISPKWRYYFQNNASGAQKSMPKINQSIVVKTLVPLPPLSEQKAIVEKLDELMGYCDGLEESIKNSQKENKMLLQQVLREALEPKKITPKVNIKFLVNKESR